MEKKEEDGWMGIGGKAITLTTSKVITLVISTITSMMLVRFRTLDEYGTYSAILLVINLFTAIFMFGLPNSINYFLARAESIKEKKHFLSVYYTLSSILSIVIGALLVIAIPMIEVYFNNKRIGSFFYFLAIYPWASIIITSLDNVLVVYNRIHILIAYKVLYSFAMLLAVLIIQWHGFGFDMYMLVFCTMNLCFAISVYVICDVVSGGIRMAFDSELIKTVFVFSVPVGLSTLVGTLSLEIDKLLIGKLMDTAQLAIYSNAAKELPLTIVASSITAVLLPKITVMVKEKRVEESIELWGNATVLSLMLITITVAGLFVYAEDVMTFLYSSKYLSGVSVFRIYTLTMLVRCTYFGMILNSLGQTKKILYCSVVNLILNAVLNPLFFVVFGIDGPALATLVSMVAMMFLMLYLTTKATNVRYSKIFPWKKAISVIFINIPFSVLFWIIKVMLPLDNYVGSLLESLLLGGFWAITYFLILKNKFLYYWNSLNC